LFSDAIIPERLLLFDDIKMMDASKGHPASPSGKGYTDKLSLQELKQLCPIRHPKNKDDVLVLPPAGASLSIFDGTLVNTMTLF
jgi:hypothetical protein